MERAVVREETESTITFRWNGSTRPATAPDTTPGVPAETKLSLPAGVALEVVSQRLPISDAEASQASSERLATTLIDGEGWFRCNGIGPGLESEWREVCRVRPAGPFPEPSTWTVRVAELQGDAPSAGSAIPFEMEVTVRALAPGTIASLGETLDFEAAAHDGVKLRGHVYVPAGPGPFATVLIYQPYWNHGGSVASDALARGYDARATLVRPWGTFLDAGFAVAAVNSRGSGLSDGCYEYMNHPRNGPDANAVVDAIAAQPWSNGRVGMYGVSYPAATQFAAIGSDPSPQLAAVMPLSGEWDEWNFLAIWGASYVGAESHPTNRNFQQGLGGAGFLAGAQSQRVSAPTPEHWCQDTVMSQYNWNQLILNGDKTEWFQARDLRDGIEQSKVPIFMTNGLTDGEGSHRSTPYDLWNLVSAPQRWLLGQYPHGAPGRDYVGFNWDYAIPWFDHYLRDGPAIETGIVDYQDDRGAWHRADSWPPAGTRVELFLSDGRLVDDKSTVKTSEQRAVNNDAETAGPGDCGVTAMYVSEPFDQEVLLAGEFYVNFTATSTAPNGNVAAYVFASPTDPGCGTPLSSGAEGEHLLRYALSDLRHRGHLEQGEEVVPGTPLTMSMRSFPFAARVPEGERLVLVIASGHPDLTPKPFQPILTVSTGPQLEGRLSFTIVD